MSDKIKKAEDCPCPETDCAVHGDCVACVAGHRKHKQHIPACLQGILRDQIIDLAAKVELKTTPAK